MSEILRKLNGVDMCEWATKTFLNDKYHANIELSSDEQDVTRIIDEKLKAIGEEGHDEKHMISALIKKTITDDYLTTPNDLLNRLMEINTIGEFDDYETLKDVDGLTAYDAVIGGNVDRSFYDKEKLTPTYQMLQVESDISFQRLRRYGSGEVAKIIGYMRDAVDLQRFAYIMNAIDTGITGGAQVIVGGANLSEANVDALILYLFDVSTGGAPFIFALNKYIQTIASFPKASDFASDRVKDMFYRDGFLREYGGATLYGISEQRTLKNGQLAIPDKRVFGASGQIGTLVMRGTPRIYQEDDIDSEKLHIKFTGYTFGATFENIKKAAKITLT